MPYRQNFPIPAVIDPPKTCLCIEIPNHPDWKRVIAGLLSELRYWYNWERTGTMAGAECAAVWKDVYNSIDWSDMSCCCGGDFAVIYRWTELGVLQSSSDGGTTWVDDPSEDPRNSSPVYPPVPGEPSPDKRCDAAEGMGQLIKEQVGDQLTDDMSRYTLGQLITDWIKIYLQTSNPFLALLNIAANQIFALIIALVRSALTTEVYHQLVCAFYCHMEDDLSFTEAGWGAVRDDILGNIEGIAGVFLEHLVFLLGAVGLTNLARSQVGASGTCDDCECFEGPRVYLWDELAESSTQIFPDETGLYTAPSGVTPSGPNYIATIFFNGPTVPPMSSDCYSIYDVSNPSGATLFPYDCDDGSYNPLATCIRQATWARVAGPFTVTFRVSDLCGAW